MARRLDQLKLLNMDRWKAHIQERSTREEGAVLVSADPLGDAHNAHPAPTPTAGELFNRPNSMHNGEFVPRYHRKEDAQESKLSGKQGWADPERMRRTTTPRNGGANWMTTREAVPTSGDDFTSVPLFSPFKYRVPVDSVTRKQGDCRLFLCCGWRWTAAQWIWALNLVCFIAHTSMIVLTYWLAYWRHDLDPMNDTKHVMIPIYRIRSIPTQGMLDKNLSRWAEGWNLTSTEPNSGLFLQLDDGFAWWRWAEYSISASVMGVAMAITLGIREQNTLAAIFMLIWCCMAFGFLTEYVSTPKSLVDTVNHKYPVGPYQLRKFADSSNNEYGKTDYYRDPNALKLISQDEWECDRPMYDITNLNQPVGLERIDSNVRAQRTANYIRRMIPHVFGWFPMMAVWFILIVQLENAKRDIDEISDRNIPGWVESLIYGQFLIFTQFAFTQIVFQRLNPGFYWGTELAYCILSLSAKLYLGGFLLVNVIMADASVNDTLGGAGETRR